MKGVVYRGPGKVEVCAHLPRPRAGGPRDALVRVTASAICGTDLHPYRGEIPAFAPGTVLGHEFTGVVVEAGAEVPFAPGERVVASDIVACGRCERCARGWHYQCPQVTLFGYSTVVGRPLDGGQAEYVLVPFADVVLTRCPEDLTDEQALFVGDVLTTGYTAAHAAAITPGDVVGVVGAGPVGLLSAQCAAAFGAAHVVVSDPDPRRRSKAGEMGFTAVAPDGFTGALRGASAGPGAAAVIEAVGTAGALACAMDGAGHRATVVAVGSPSSQAAPIAAQAAFARELTLRFAVGDPIRWREQVLSLLRAGRLDPTPVISHRLPLSEAVRGYELFDSREALKVVLLPDAA
ncbi:alcohol dehydrogenase catalytic domain-containing protein [Streptomyces sp. NPDC026206]|uniref:alcohol dehydrogenase catalytic domain-containing protein n=1 Tax=Streptomyces sp. NPDC026206 TaxID=3157089 RepID=UPI0033D2D29C